MHIGQTISSFEFQNMISKGRKSMKALYTPSGSKLKEMDAIFDFYLEHSVPVQYAVTLQTKLIVQRGYDLSDKQMISLTDDFRVFVKRLQREVYVMAHRRSREGHC